MAKVIVGTNISQHWHQTCRDTTPSFTLLLHQAINVRTTKVKYLCENQTSLAKRLGQTSLSLTWKCFNACNGALSPQCCLMNVQYKICRWKSWEVVTVLYKLKKTVYSYVSFVVFESVKKLPWTTWWVVVASYLSLSLLHLQNDHRASICVECCQYAKDYQYSINTLQTRGKNPKPSESW